MLDTKKKNNNHCKKHVPRHRYFMKRYGFEIEYCESTVMCCDSDIFFPPNIVRLFDPGKRLSAVSISE